MAFNPYVPNSREKSITPWSTVIDLAVANNGCSGLFSLYASQGDKTAAKGNAITGAYTVSTVLDGPEKVIRFGELEIGNGSTLTTFTASQRCKGLVILCDKLTVKANATLHMTGKGARVDRADDPMFPFVDYKIPFKINLSSSRMSLAQVLAVIKSMGLAPWDQGTFQHLISGMFGFSLLADNTGAVTLLSVAGCAEGPNGANITGAVGATGNYGTSGGTGSGGTGGTNASCSAGKGGKGCPYSGGSGSGASNVTYSYPGPAFSGCGGWGGGADTSWWGRYAGTPTGSSASGGGGAGNPGGFAGSTTAGSPGSDGCGGKLTIICRGLVTVNSGSPVGKIEANGMPGGAGATGISGGGGSGGGHISIISTSAVSNSGTIQAAGGAGGAGGTGNAGGPGGKGSVGNHAAGTDKFLTFTDMGW